MGWWRLAVWTLVPVFLIVLETTLGAPSNSKAATCRCVPSQWEGVLLTTDHEFDLRGGRAATQDTNMLVYYDFLNKKFAMVDMKTGNRAIADYNKGRRYVQRKGFCRSTPAPRSMREMCLPENAVSLGDFQLNSDVPVELWRFDVPFNLSMETLVATPSCIPVTEKIYVKKPDFATVTTSMYLDVSLGIRDESVFKPPLHCSLDDQEQNHPNAVEKRGDNEVKTSSFLDWMREEAGEL